MHTLKFTVTRDVCIHLENKHTSVTTAHSVSPFPLHTCVKFSLLKCVPTVILAVRRHVGLSRHDAPRPHGAFSRHVLSVTNCD